MQAANNSARDTRITRPTHTARHVILTICGREWGWQYHEVVCTAAVGFPDAAGGAIEMQ